MASTHGRSGMDGQHRCEEHGWTGRSLEQGGARPSHRPPAGAARARGRRRAGSLPARRAGLDGVAGYRLAARTACRTPGRRRLGSARLGAGRAEPQRAGRPPRARAGGSRNRSLSRDARACVPRGRRPVGDGRGVARRPRRGGRDRGRPRRAGLHRHPAAGSTGEGGRGRGRSVLAGPSRPPRAHPWPGGRWIERRALAVARHAARQRSRSARCQGPRNGALDAGTASRPRSAAGSMGGRSR